MFFIGIALKSTLVLGVAWLVTILLRGRSAAARHLVWTAGAAAVLALPLLSVSLPVLRVTTGSGLLTASGLPTFQAVASATTEAPAARASQPRRGVALDPAPRRPGWGLWMLLIWGAGTAAAFARTLVACFAIWRVRRSAGAFFDRDLCAASSQALGIREPVDVLESQAGSMPMTCGFLRAAILMPSDAAQWTEERRRIVLLHELAHVRRGDVATQFLARTACALYWWNPLAWFAWREFLKERERAADDLVLKAGARASEYANHLLDVARSMQASSSTVWASVAMARRSQLEGRLLAILDSRVNRNSAGRPWAIGALMLAVAMVAPLAAVRAQSPQPEGVPPDVAAAIRFAVSAKNYKLLDDAGEAAEQARKYDAERELLEAALAIRANVSGQQSADYGVGLLKLADLERKQHGLKAAALELYTKAAPLLGARPEAAHALMYLGIGSIMAKDFPAAIADFEQAQRVDPSQAGMALMWMAIAQRNQQNPGEADRLFRSALAVEDPGSIHAVSIMRVYSHFLRQQGREEEANQMDAAILAARRAKLAQTRSTPRTADVYRLGGGISAPSVLSKVEPEYTDEARAAKLAGTVILYVEIGPDGAALNARVIQALGLGLDGKALEAISQWRFKPGMKDGQPVTVMATIEVNFRLL